MKFQPRRLHVEQYNLKNFRQRPELDCAAVNITVYNISTSQHFKKPKLPVLNGLTCQFPHFIGHDLTTSPFFLQRTGLICLATTGQPPLITPRDVALRQSVASLQILQNGTGTGTNSILQHACLRPNSPTAFLHELRDASLTHDVRENPFNPFASINAQTARREMDERDFSKRNHHSMDRSERPVRHRRRYHLECGRRAHEQDCLHSRSETM